MDVQVIKRRGAGPPIHFSPELETFHDVAKALTSSLDLDTILKTIMQKMAEYFRPEIWSLWMVDETEGELYSAIAVGLSEGAMKNVRLPVGSGVAGWVAQHGEQVFVPELRADARFARYPEEMPSEAAHSMLCVPLVAHQHGLGVISLVNVDLAGFSEQEIVFLNALCDYAAIAIENARAVAKIRELTITDDCTGLYNARHLYRMLDAEVYRSSRYGYDFTVLFIDLDYFKKVNDTYGHLTGSRVLGQVGKLIKDQLRMIDTAFRYGGDEFVVLLPQTGKDAALVVARRLLEAFRRTQLPQPAGFSINVRASIGVASYPGDARSPHELIHLADERMYVVKNGERDGVAGVAGR